MRCKLGEIIVAAARGDVKEIERCVRLGASVDEQGTHGYTPLIVAASGGHQAAVEYLLTLGANVHLCNTAGASALRTAAVLGHQKICEVLLNAGAKRNAPMVAIAVQRALEKGNREIAAFLRSQVAPRVAHSALMDTILRSDTTVVDSVRQLVLLNVDLNEPSPDTGKTPLLTAMGSIATQQTQCELVRLLLRSRAKPDLPVEGGVNALHNSAHADPAVLQLLVRHLDSAAVSAPDAKKDTPLHLHASLGNVEQCRVLLVHNAKLNETNSAGNTPLHLAVSNGRMNVVLLLLAAGADITIRNADGHAPMNIASPHELGDVDMRDLFGQYAETQAVCLSCVGGLVVFNFCPLAEHSDLQRRYREGQAVFGVEACGCQYARASWRMSAVCLGDFHRYCRQGHSN